MLVQFSINGRVFAHHYIFACEVDAYIRYAQYHGYGVAIGPIEE